MINNAIFRAQAAPITIVILVAVTILLGLGVFTLFQGEASRLLERLSINQVIVGAANSLRVAVVASESDTSTPPSLYCFTISINNVAGGPLTVYITALPLTTLGNSFITDYLASVYPIKYNALNVEDGLNVKLYFLEDLNGDGLIDFVGSDPLNPDTTIILSTELPDCRTIYNTQSIWDSYIRPSTYINIDSIYIIAEGFTVKDLYDGFQVNYYPLAPLWRLQLQPGESVTLHLVIALEDPNNPNNLLELTSGSLIITVNISKNYYVSLNIDLVKYAR